MTEVQKSSRFKKFLKWVFIRFPIVLGIIGLVMIGALKLVERYPEPLRQGFEEFLSQDSNSSATIGVMEKITFFPNFNIKIRDLTLHNKDNAAIIDVEIKSLEISSPFWSMFFGGSRLNKLFVEGLTAQAGAITPQDLSIQTMSIVDRGGPDQYGSFLVVTGQYGDQPLLVEAELEKMPKGYRVPKNVAFSLSVGQVQVSAMLVKGLADLQLMNTVYTKGEKQGIAADYILVKGKEYLKDNPLSCLFYYGDAPDCDEYLEVEEKDSP